MLTKLIVVIVLLYKHIANHYTYIMYTLNGYNVRCQLYLNKTF